MRRLSSLAKFTSALGVGLGFLGLSQPSSLIPDGRLRLLHISFDVRKGKKRARGTAILNSPPFLVLVGLPFSLVVLLCPIPR